MKWRINFGIEISKKDKEFNIELMSFKNFVQLFIFSFLIVYSCNYNKIDSSLKSSASKALLDTLKNNSNLILLSNFNPKDSVLNFGFQILKNEFSNNGENLDEYYFTEYPKKIKDKIHFKLNHIEQLIYLQKLYKGETKEIITGNVSGKCGLYSVSLSEEEVNIYLYQ